MKNIKKLERILKLRKAMKVDINNDDFEEMVDSCGLYRFLDAEKIPKKKTNHVGIEIEFYSRTLRTDIALKLINKGLGSKISLGEDGSLDSYGHELRILDTEKNISKTLKKVFKVLKSCKSWVNNTCGLHVHLDMRNRDHNKVYDKLVYTQPILYGMVDGRRLHNSYCSKSIPRGEWNFRPLDKYRTINYGAYEHLKTLEVRLHQGSMNYDKVNNWVKLLLTIVNSKVDKEIVSPEALNVKGTLKTYLKKTFKEKQARLGKFVKEPQPAYRPVAWINP